ncbi:MAG: CotH kinase family protein [Lachnospiraceae bacterium]|nr:CotH kinase family protein [Lachnospiraceae bacterium]
MNTKNIPISDIDHDMYSDTSISLISPAGKTTYVESNAQIKGRGNATWRGEKKPYELKLPQKSGLCGMSASKKWALIANYFEPTKMYNKLAFDVSSDIGMEYAIESDWVDLYANGEYLGNYLLCREPNIGSSDLDIGSLESMNDPYFASAVPYEDTNMKGFIYENAAQPEAGGYLIEKNTDSYYGHKNCGFKTLYNYFTIKSPNNASMDQVKYISDFVNMVDNAIRSNNTDKLSYVDNASFVRRFLVEELFFNDDAFVASYYFYKKPDDNSLYAGPVWDYDGAVGEEGGMYADYTRSILDQQHIILEEDMEFRNPLDWDVILYEDDDYRDYLVKVFTDNLPVFTDLVKNRIDNYYEKIEASLRMDYAIWRRGWGAGHYEIPYNNVRYAKFFLAQRIAYLCRKWGVSDPMADYDLSDGSSHILTMVMPDGTDTSITVSDGTQIYPDSMPSYDESAYLGWYYLGSDEPFSFFIPIYEDTTLELAPAGNE